MISNSSKRLAGATSIFNGWKVANRTRNFTSIRTVKSKNLSVVGAVSSLGQPHLGVQTGPQILRNAGLQTVAEDLGWNYTDCGDVVFDANAQLPMETPEGGVQSVAPLVRKPPSPEAKSLIIGEKSLALANVIKARAAEDDFVLTLGGDHSIAIGTGAGVIQHNPDVGIIWVDAHCDINTPQSSGSGNIHGMVVAFLMKLVGPNYPGFEWIDGIPKLNPDQIVYVGARDIDQAERVILKEQGIKVLTMNAVDKFGIGKVMEMALDHLGDRELHVSYDIDALDPAFAPSTGTPVRGGLTWREAQFIAEESFATGRLKSMDMVEVNPLLQANEGRRTADVALDIIGSALGKTIL